ncbi:class I SAM-dependent methyltransferase [uncultured Shewanella sp.]|uniref:class I SAM-dependent methyltransferase n=1 Tax=uncultured Shewanella sp. TaxID=173975 RepID=UPI00261009B5|nr:class I SAM-dependent methyltransferase [uncultured Shewanella sp.]
MSEENNYHDWFRSTVNHKGVMVKQFSDVSQYFIRDAVNASHTLIDMGCAYGIATLPILEMHKNIVACDLSQEHLDILKQETPEKLLPYLTLKQGDFPYDFSFEKNSISGIHCSYIFNLMTAEAVSLALTHCFNWLIPGGKLYINAPTPYLNGLNFIDEFQRREANGEPFPGIIDKQSMASFIQQGLQEMMSTDGLLNFLHVFTKESLSKVLIEKGFLIDFSQYFDIKIPSQLDPLIGGNGKASIGIIARKP